MSVMAEVVKRTSVPTANMEALKEEVRELSRHRNELLPCEADLANHLETRAASIKREMEIHLAARYGKRSEPLPVLDPAVLSWRHDRYLGWVIPVPKLALVDVIQGVMKISNDPENRTGMGGTSIPQALRTSYADVADGLQARRRRRDLNWCNLSFKYHGAIPSDVRKLIRDESPNFESINLLVEAPRESWEYSQQKKPPKPRVWDPLVLGYRNGGLFLLGQFDPTPIERYIELEFTRQPALLAGK